MRADWDGHYLDGQSAVRRPVRIRIARTGLEITLADTGATLWWSLADIRQTQGFYAGEQVRLERGPAAAEALLVADVAFLSAVRAIAPDAAGALHDPRRRPLRVPLTALAAVATLALALALYLWGIPGLAAVAAARVPPAWEAGLGRAVVDQLVRPDRRCVDPERQQVIDAIMARLLRAAPGQPYTFRVTIADDPRVNAVAAPGGALVVFRGLLERSESPEELAGVLAHEIQHVLHRHATQAIFQRASTGVLMAALVGDVSGMAAVALDAARTLGDLRHSRQHEAEADRDGMRMLHAAAVDPRGMLAFFEALERLERRPDPSGLGQYLTTHPPTGDRLATLRALARAAERPAVPLVVGADWEDVRDLCARRPPGSPRR